MTYVTPADQIGDKSGFEISRESRSKPSMAIIVIFQFVKKCNLASPLTLYAVLH